MCKSNRNFKYPWVSRKSHGQISLMDNYHAEIAGSNSDSSFNMSYDLMHFHRYFSVFQHYMKLYVHIWWYYYVFCMQNAYTVCNSVSRNSSTQVCPRRMCASCIKKCSIRWFHEILEHSHFVWV